MEESAVVADLKQFIETNILAKSGRLQADTVLREAGIDSFSIIEIVLFIQEKYGVTVGDDQLLPENFNTLGTLARMVKTLSE